VKICTLYGDGFYYIPGTQTCMKIGGFLRTEVNVHAAGSFTPFTNGSNAFQYRGEDNYITRARGVVTFDVREQTNWGTLRAYIAGGWQYSSNDAPTLSLAGAAVAAGGGAASPANTNNSNTYLLRAFIQLGGFTFGKTASFYDFFNTSKYSLQTNFIYQDFAGVGVFTYGYTQQLGNGLGFTVAAQDPTPFMHPIVDLGDTAAAPALAFPAPGAAPGSVALGGPTNNGFQNAGTLVPDFVLALRADQAWGGAQVAALLHDNRVRYFNQTANGQIAGVGHPDDKWGFAVMGGIELNLPWAKGDSLGVQSQYCVGVAYACYNNSGSRVADLSWSLVNPGTIGLGWLDDAFIANVAGRDNSIQQATNWNIWAAIQHYWAPDLRTSLYGGYTAYKANSSDIDALVCAPLHAAQAAISATGCADWAAWAMGSRSIWNPVKNLDVGVDVLYTSMAKSAFQGARVTFAPGGSAAATTVNVGNTHIWAGILRIQYNFYP